MDDDTVAVYEARAKEWAEKRPPRFRDEARAFAAAVPPGRLRLDLGSGPASYAADLGRPLVMLDAAYEMVRLARLAAPHAACVQADISALPFAPCSVGGGWARATYHHLPRGELPFALADLHRTLSVDAALTLSMTRGDFDWDTIADDSFEGRFFAAWQPDALERVIVGAGFTVTRIAVDESWIHAHARRARTLPDYVAAGLRVLVVGLNPSLRAADAGVGFATPGNRFWPAALAAGIVGVDRDPRDAVLRYGTGMTDLVKDASPSAARLTVGEYRAGAARVEALVRWLTPRVVCFVGLAGYRAAVDKGARAGRQAADFGGAATYVMPNTSGLNAKCSLGELTDHLRAARALADRAG
jgi:TDG/mug DNA glycosylase family protein